MHHILNVRSYKENVVIDKYDLTVNHSLSLEIWLLFFPKLEYTGCSKKHGNSVTNWISSLLWISIVIFNFKSHNITMSARVQFMNTVNGCKDVSIMYPQDEQWRRTSLLCLYTEVSLFYKVQPYAVKT